MYVRTQSRTHISRITSPKVNVATFLCLLPVAMAQSSFDIMYFRFSDDVMFLHIIGSKKFVSHKVGKIDVDSLVQ